jgi:glutathione peroxidase
MIMRNVLWISAIGLTVSALAQQVEPPKGGTDVPRTAGTPTPKPTQAESARSALDFTVKDIDGKEVPLARYRGDVLLIVNVASECGFTKQYKQMQEIYEKYRDRGFRILAFPSNDFGGQEPGTNEEIRQFCKSKFGVTFDLFDKVPVKGDAAVDLYKFLTSKERNGDKGGAIKWNFTKFLVDREGRVTHRFEPKVTPDAPEAIDAIEAALQAPRPAEAKP